MFSSGSVRLPLLRFPNPVIKPDGFSSRFAPWATSPAVNSGDKMLSEITSGLAAGTPLTLLLKTLTSAPAAFKAAMVTSAMVVATSEQDLACSGFLRVSSIIYLCWFVFVSVGAAIDRALETATREL